MISLIPALVDAVRQGDDVALHGLADLARDVGAPGASRLMSCTRTSANPRSTARRQKLLTRALASIELWAKDREAWHRWQRELHTPNPIYEATRRLYA